MQLDIKDLVKFNISLCFSRSMHADTKCVLANNKQKSLSNAAASVDWGVIELKK